MVLYYDPLPKMESMEWRIPSEGAPRKAKALQSAKIMPTISCDFKDILMVDFKERNTTGYKGRDK